MRHLIDSGHYLFKLNAFVEHISYFSNLFVAELGISIVYLASLYHV